MTLPEKYSQLHGRPFFPPSPSASGYTNLRIKDWIGRADQTTKVKGMFVRPEQVAEVGKWIADESG